jgi:hypothetical protein
MEWLSVKDKLPDKSIISLVYIPECDVYGPEMSCSVAHYEGIQIENFIQNKFESVEVSHWMALPLFPKENMNGWVSVTDKLPNYKEKVLIFTDNFCWYCRSNRGHLHHEKYYPDNIYIGSYSPKDITLFNYYKNTEDRSWDWCGEDHWSPYGQDVPTYWMPLPQKPQ